MPNFICVRCGTQYAATETNPKQCPICNDDREYVKHGGQEWTTLKDLSSDRSNQIQSLEPNLTGIGTKPSFAIGQRALLLQTPAGNVLWDCISLIDDATIEAVRQLGGIAAIAISHPHYYSSMVEWSHAFDRAPIYLHAGDRAWVMRPDPAIVFWEGKTHPLFAGLTLIHCGGHFSGATVLHWPDGAEGRGALLSGDIIQVVGDRRYLSFMYSYPNYIPMSADAVRFILKSVEPFAYDRIYGAWWGYNVFEDAKNAVARSADRYIAAIQGDWTPATAPDLEL